MLDFLNDNKEIKNKMSKVYMLNFSKTYVKNIEEIKHDIEIGREVLGDDGDKYEVEGYEETLFYLPDKNLFVDKWLINDGEGEEDKHDAFCTFKYDVYSNKFEIIDSEILWGHEPMRDVTGHIKDKYLNNIQHDYTKYGKNAIVRVW
jgi:hypothetical protein